MGYRDDLSALESRRAVLQRDLGQLGRELVGLDKEAVTLRRRIAHQRLRLVLVGVGRWLLRHPKTTALLLLVVGIALYVFIKQQLEASRLRQQIAAAVGMGCKTRLQVKASSARARVYINGLRLGEVPQQINVCPGVYRVAVVHDQALPWQTILRVGNEAQRAVDVPLIPWDRTAQRPEGTLVFTDPEGALVFANGQELGEGPIFLHDSQFAPERPQRLAVWAEGYQPVVWSGKPGREIWLHLRARKEGGR